MADEQVDAYEEVLENLQRTMNSNPEQDETSTAELIDRIRAMKSRASYYEDDKRQRQISYRQELIVAYWRWNQGDSQSQIYTYLRNTTEYETVGMRTITRWLSWFRQLPDSEVEQDRDEIYFHQLADYGIPFHYYSSLVQSGVSITPRYAKWFIRLQSVRLPVQGNRAPRQLEPTRLKTYLNDFVENEQFKMLNVPHNLIETSKRLKKELIGGQQ